MAYLPLGPLWQQTLPRVVFFLFFSTLCARFVYFCLPGYSGWCVSFTHTHHTFPISCYLRTLCTGSGFACSGSQLSGKLSLLAFIFFRSFKNVVSLLVHAENLPVSVTFLLLLLLCVVSTTAVRGVQRAAGELCPSGGCSLADRETMEETGGGRGVQRSQRPRQAPPSPREPRLASQPRLLLQEVSSLLKMPR